MKKYALIILAIIVLNVVGFYIFGYEETYLELTDSEHAFNNEMNQLNQTGHTEPWAEVTINSEKVPVDKSGNFYKIVNIQNGLNTINVTSKAPFKSSVSRIATVKRTEENNRINVYYQINNTIQRK